MVPLFSSSRWTACLLILCACSQEAQESPEIQQARREADLFRKYAVQKKQVKWPALPQLTTKLARCYPTQLQLQAAKGPNFAGHYTLASWSCGSGCLDFAVIDAVTGDVVFDPKINRINRSGLTSTRRFIYKQDSRLLIVEGGLEYSEDSIEDGLYYFEWTGTRFRPIN